MVSIKKGDFNQREAVSKIKPKVEQSKVLFRSRYRKHAPERKKVHACPRGGAVVSAEEEEGRRGGEGKLLSRMVPNGNSSRKKGPFARLSTRIVRPPPLYPFLSLSLLHHRHAGGKGRDIPSGDIVFCPSFPPGPFPSFPFGRFWSLLRLYFIPKAVGGRREEGDEEGLGRSHLPAARVAFAAAAGVSGKGVAREFESHPPPPPQTTLFLRKSTGDSAEKKETTNRIECAALLLPFSRKPSREVGRGGTSRPLHGRRRRRRRRMDGAWS